MKNLKNVPFIKIFANCFIVLFLISLYACGSVLEAIDPSDEEGSEKWQKEEMRKIAVKRMEEANVVILAHEDSVKMIKDGRYLVYVRNTHEKRVMPIVITKKNCYDEVVKTSIIDALESKELFLDEGEYTVYYNMQSIPETVKDRKKLKQGKDFDHLTVDPSIVQDFLGGKQCMGSLLHEGKVKDPERSKAR